MQLTASERLAAKKETIVVGLEFEVVANRNGRNHNALLASERFADTGDAGEQIATRLCVGHVQETVPYLDREDIGLDQLADIIAGSGRRAGASAAAVGSICGGSGLLRHFARGSFIGRRSLRAV